MNKDELIEYLAKNLSEGNKWVAYPLDKPDLDSYDLTCFASSRKAEKFCEPQYSYLSGVEECDNRDYRYVAIEPTLEQLRFHSSGNQQTVAHNKETITAELSKYPVTPNFYSSREKLMDSLAKDEVNAVNWKKEIIPKDEISSYHIFEHTYPRGMVYEIGHQIKTAGVYPDFAAAMTGYNSIIQRAAPTDRLTELILIGQFNDKQLEINYECKPEANCGILVTSQTLPSSNKQNVENSYSIDLAKPYTMEEHVFARMDRSTNTLQFYDDQLNRIDITKAHFSVDTFSFHNQQRIFAENLQSKHQTHQAGDTARTITPAKALAEFLNLQPKTEQGPDQQRNRLG